MAEAKHTHTPPPAYLDGCPMCLTRDRVPTCIAAAGANVPGIVADYRCKDCGHTWRTSWATGWGAA